MSKPEKVFRHGGVKVAVFVSQSESGRLYRTIMPSRAYKTDGGWEYTTAFNAAQALLLQRLISQAVDFIIKMDEDTPVETTPPRGKAKRKPVPVDKSLRSTEARAEYDDDLADVYGDDAPF